MGFIRIKCLMFSFENESWKSIPFKSMRVSNLLWKSHECRIRMSYSNKNRIVGNRCISPLFSISILNIFTLSSKCISKRLYFLQKQVSGFFFFKSCHWQCLHVYYMYIVQTMIDSGWLKRINFHILSCGFYIIALFEYIKPLWVIKQFYKFVFSLLTVSHIRHYKSCNITTNNEIFHIQ